MAKCSRCHKLYLFKSFPSGICPSCEKQILKEKEDREFQEYQERRRREIEEEKRIEAEKAERARIEQLLTLPNRFWGCDLAYQYEDVRLFVPSSELFSKMSVGTELFGIQEPDNPHDSKAVRLILSGETLAYFYRGKLQDMANDYLQFGGRVYGIVSSLSPEDQTIMANIGYYKGVNQDEFKSLYHRFPHSKLYRLTGSSSEDRQTNIMISNIGDKCSLEYDYDKEKYLVLSPDELGYLSASAAKLVDDYGEFSCQVFIGSIDFTDSGKYAVSVYVFNTD